ncbi:hypothetical protein D4764_03G0009540, partial [Takifugu flavidus]
PHSAAAIKACRHAVSRITAERWPARACLAPLRNGSCGQVQQGAKKARFQEK